MTNTSRIASRRAPRQDGRLEVHLVGAVAEPVLVQLQPRRPEGVGLHHVAADREVARVDVLDEVGAGEGEEVVGALLAAELGRLELMPLDLGAHGAVEHEGAPLDRFSEGHVWSFGVNGPVHGGRRREITPRRLPIERSRRRRRPATRGPARPAAAPQPRRD
jgi:hypothetical protein